MNKILCHYTLKNLFKNTFFQIYCDYLILKTNNNILQKNFKQYYQSNLQSEQYLIQTYFLNKFSQTHFNLIKHNIFDAYLINGSFNSNQIKILQNYFLSKQYFRNNQIKNEFCKLMEDLNFKNTDNFSFDTIIANSIYLYSYHNNNNQIILTSYQEYQFNHWEINNNTYFIHFYQLQHVIILKTKIINIIFILIIMVTHRYLILKMMNF